MLLLGHYGIVPLLCFMIYVQLRKRHIYLLFLQIAIGIKACRLPEGGKFYVRGQN